MTLFALAIRIALAGDSTVTDASGWGKGFAAHMAPRAEVLNFAKSGRSSKSFRDEGHWEKVLAAKPDYVLIQFGHNDQPGKGPARETDPATTYRELYAAYIREARAAGIRPVLVTSLVRRTFRDDGLDLYAEAARAVAAGHNVPLIDLYARSRAAVEKLGQAAADTIGPVNDGKPDRTHLNEAGSNLFGAMVAEELGRVVPALRARAP
ncbi:MAG: rhamnogalacturonan acetylesterase [Acidobacteria bacterium]|nr:rhamnogalacturonan acetylesterase [Acidobacteriota bacterium]